MAGRLQSKVIYNGKITIENIPEEAYDYVVNGKPALGLENVVRIQIYAGRRRASAAEIAYPHRGVSQDSIRLDTEGINGYRYGLTLIVKSIQNQHDVVVRIDFIAVRKRSSYLSVRLVGTDSKIDSRRRVPYENLRRVLRRAPVHRKKLIESC